MEEKRCYDAQAHLQQRVAPPGAGVPRLAPLHLLQSAVGAQTATVAVWRAEEPCLLPHADLVVFERAGAVLGQAPFEAVARVLGEGLAAAPTYPPRYEAAAFPEEWRLAEIGLHPWQGPAPG